MSRVPTGTVGTRIGSSEVVVGKECHRIRPFNALAGTIAKPVECLGHEPLTDSISSHLIGRNMKNWDVFLGGYDLEMVEIAKLLATRDDVVVHDRHLAWGARASEYATEIEGALGQSPAVVLVELIDDLSERFPRDRITFVDHHGSKAGEHRPTFDRTGLRPARIPRRGLDG